MHVWNVLHAARWKYTARKKTQFWHHRTTFSGCIFTAEACIDNRKKNLLNIDTSSTCPHNMVNFGLLTAEIRWRVWSTPANFNGFRVLAALLHGTLASANLCGVEQRAPPIFGRATITLGIGPYSSLYYKCSSSAYGYYTNSKLFVDHAAIFNHFKQWRQLLGLRPQNSHELCPWTTMGAQPTNPSFVLPL